MSLLYQAISPSSDNAKAPKPRRAGLLLLAPCLLVAGIALAPEQATYLLSDMTHKAKALLHRVPESIQTKLGLSAQVDPLQKRPQLARIDLDALVLPPTVALDASTPDAPSLAAAMRPELNPEAKPSDDIKESGSVQITPVKSTSSAKSIDHARRLANAGRLGEATLAVAQTVHQGNAEIDSVTSLITLQIRQGNLSEASTQLQQARTRWSDDPGLQLAEAALLMARQHPEDAVQRLLRIKPRNRLHYRAQLQALGDAYTAMGDRALALDIFTRALRTFPQTSSLWLSLGQLLAQDNQIIAANRALEQAVIFSDPNSSTHKNARITLQEINAS